MKYADAITSRSGQPLHC